MVGRLRETWAFRASPEALLVQLYSLNIALAVALGVILLSSGEKKFHEPSFASARRLVAWIPGDPHTVWGVAFLVLAMLLLAGLGRPKGAAVAILRIGIVVYLFLALACLTAFVQQATEAGAVLGVAFLAFAVTHLLLSVHLDGYGWR